MKKSNLFAVATVCAALFAGLAISQPAEAGFGIPKIKVNVGGNKAPAQTSNTNTSDPSIVGWTIAGTANGDNGALKGLRVYLVEYTDGGETPQWHVQGNTLVFDNIKKGEAIAFSQEDGKFQSGAFRAPRRINLIAYAPQLGFTYRTVEKRTNDEGSQVFDMRGGNRGSGTTTCTGIIK